MQKLTAILFAALLILGAGSLTSNYSQSYIADKTNGCAVYNAYPVPGESIKYEGGCLNGKAEGYGKVTWMDRGRITGYDEGYYKEGKRNGKVTETNLYPFKYVKEAEYINNKLHGSFSITTPFNQSTAQYQNGKIVYPATVIWKNGKKFVGEIEDFQNANGEGTIIFPNGDKYEGEFKDNKRDGDGVYTWANGISFKGEYSNDIRENGSFYKDDLPYEGIETSELKEEISFVKRGLLQSDEARKLTREIKERIRVPSFIFTRRIALRVITSFTVSETGNITDVEIDYMEYTVRHLRNGANYQIVKDGDLTPEEHAEVKRCINEFFRYKKVTPFFEEGTYYTSQVKIPIVFSKW